MLRKWTLCLWSIVLLTGITLLPVTAQDNGTPPGWTTFTGADGVPHHEDRVDFTRIMTIEVAPDNTIWVGTLDGLAHFDGETWTTYTEDDGLASNCILSVSFAPDGAVWVAASSYYPGYYPLCTRGSISRFDGTSWFTFSEENGLATEGKYYSVVTTPDDLIWAGHGTGILQFDGTTWVEMRPGASVTAMTTTSDSTLWVGGDFNSSYCSPNWLSRYDGTTWTTFTQDDGLIDGCLTSIAVAADGTIWVVGNSERDGKLQGGVAHFDGARWTTYTVEDHPALEFPHSVAIAPDGTVWITAWGHGILQFDGETWTLFTTEDGLAGNIVTSVAAAPDATMWIGTHSGVSRYIPPRD